MTAADTKRVFWKCTAKGCKQTRVTDLPVSRDCAYIPGEGHTQYRTGDWAFATADIRAAWTALGLVCPDHNALMKGETLNGTYNPDKVCDGRCMSARRSSCDCSCGGANHGGSHIS